MPLLFIEGREIVDREEEVVPFLPSLSPARSSTHSTDGLTDDGIVVHLYAKIHLGQEMQHTLAAHSNLIIRGRFR